MRITNDPFGMAVSPDGKKAVTLHNGVFTIIDLSTLNATRVPGYNQKLTSPLAHAPLNTNPFAADSGKATTRWKYDGYRGFLTNKVYDDGLGPFYSYTVGGRLRTRTWARGVVTTYHTNALGEVFATTYSDGTPAVTNQFDRLGRITNNVTLCGGTAASS